MLFDHVLNSADRQTLYRYFGEKYGLDGLLDTTPPGPVNAIFNGDGPGDRLIADLSGYDDAANGGDIGHYDLHLADTPFTDLTQTAVRRYGLDAGLVDYKISAIDGTWSGLCFARRER